MIKKHLCDNGVRIVLEHIPSVRSATIGVWIGTGSRYENDYNNGVSHFIEHMLFKGTPDHGPREIAEAFDKVGGQVNAFTSKEYTCLYAKVLDEHAAYAINILSDMVLNSTFDENELQKEKQVVFEEIKMYEDTPDDRVHDLLSEASYGQHPLGYPILGTENTLNHFDESLLRSYMSDHYQGDNIVISIAGNVDESLIETVASAFAKVEPANQQAKQAQPEFYSGKRSIKKETEQAHLCLGFNGYPLGDDRIYQLIVLNNVLGGSMSSRLFQEVREERGLAYAVFSYHSAFQDSGLLTIYGGTGADQMDQLYDTILKTLDDLKENGITPKELENSKEQIKGNLMLSLESTSSRMSRNAKNELLLQRHRSLDEMTEQISQVTLQDVRTAAQELFTDDFACSLISPTGEMPNLVKQ